MDSTNISTSSDAQQMANSIGDHMHEIEQKMKQEMRQKMNGVVPVGAQGDTHFIITHIHRLHQTAAQKNAKST